MGEVKGLTDRLVDRTNSSYYLPPTGTSPLAVGKGRPVQTTDYLWDQSVVAEDENHSFGSEVRLEVLENLLLDAFVDSPSADLFHAGRAALRIHRRLTSESPASEIRNCLREDLLSGRGDYPLTTAAVKRELTTELGLETAAFIIQGALQKKPLSGVVLFLLGPEFLYSAIDDFPRAAKNAAALTGFIFQDGVVKFDWRGKGGYSVEDERRYQPYSHVRRQLSWYRNLRPTLKKLGAFLKDCLRRDAHQAAARAKLR